MTAIAVSAGLRSSITSNTISIAVRKGNAELSVNSSRFSKTMTTVSASPRLRRISAWQLAYWPGQMPQAQMWINKP